LLAGLAAPCAQAQGAAMAANSISLFMGPAEVMNNAVRKGAKGKIVAGGAVCRLSSPNRDDHVPARPC